MNLKALYCKDLCEIVKLYLYLSTVSISGFTNKKIAWFFSSSGLFYGTPGLKSRPVVMILAFDAHKSQYC